MPKEYYLYVNGQRVKVSEQIYKVYWREKEHEKYLEQVDKKNHLLFFSSLDHDGHFVDNIVDESVNVEKIVETQMIIEAVRNAISRLNAEKIHGEVVIYTADDGNTRIDVNFIDETVWLSQPQMAELFKTSRTNIVEHIGNIYDEGELDKNSTCRDFRQVRKEGNRNVSRDIPFYNFDMIISLGYRIKSKIANDFRKWATERLIEYIITSFTMDDERLKNLSGGAYWKELLERISDIRSSEKVMYRQVLDLYATSMAT